MTDSTNKKELRLAMLGMIDGNAHPYSWAAIINGYEPAAMATAVGERYPTIVDYLGAEPPGSIGIAGARVTHVWTDDPAEAPQIARASLVEHVVKQPEDVIGAVDAVIISTDDGDDHVWRARPFIEAGLPVFVDKPLATNLADLKQFAAWQHAGHPVLSSSGMRYSPKMVALREQVAKLGELRWITSTSVKTWERYGIHALETVYPLIGPGIEAVRMHTGKTGELACIEHSSGVQLTIAILPDAPGSSGAVRVHGTRGHCGTDKHGTYASFRGQLVAYIEMLHNDGKAPFPFDETLELMCALIAGIRSREAGGTRIETGPLMDEVKNSR